MNKSLHYDIIVIGAGAGGLVVAIGTAKAGKNVLLIEKGSYGGDCTNFGCIPSKSLIASAKVVHALKTASAFGIETTPYTINSNGALSRVREIISEIRSHEDPESLKKLGVNTLTATAQFKDAHTIEASDQEGITHLVTGKQIIIATGSYPFIPEIDGLKGTPFLTNETIFNLKEIPKSLIFMGGGPISSELSLAFSYLGSHVTIVESQPHILAREDSEARNVIYDSFRSAECKLYLGHQVEKVAFESNQFSITIRAKETDQKQVLQADNLFVGVGRRPNIEKLLLDKAGVAWSLDGIKTDSYGRTTKSHIWALGDAIGPPFFTHYAENQARTIVKNLILPIKQKKSRQPIPRTTFTDPEIASIGLMPDEAKKKYGEKKIAIYTIPFNEIDRSITSGTRKGFVKVVTKKWSSRIIGATIVGARAGEMLMQISTAIYTNMPFRKFSALIHPFPIESLAIRKAADLWLIQTILPKLINRLRKK